MCAVCFLYFVFNAVWFLWKRLLLKYFNKFVVIFIISNIWEGKRVNAQNYVFYFESDIAKVSPFIPTCSSYDSEIKIKVKKSQKGGTTKLRNENKTKRNEMKRNETKYNETKPKMKKRNETKRNEVGRHIIDHLQEELYLCKLFSHRGLWSAII